MIGLDNLLAMAPPPSGQGNPLGFMFPMIILFAILYFMLIRPQQRREKERKALIESVKSGDRVLFSGGILGTVTNVKDHTLAIKISDNVKIEVARGAVQRVLDKGENPSEEDSNG
tara:strand:- start:3072 stop:3416 length:345 start_codon:yes stop_codon:yes gene_type:complete